MDTIFSEYYRITKSEEKRIWKEGLIVVDTNILLNQYRYSKATSDKVITVLTHLKDSLWIPYQVGLEFQNERLDCFYNSWNASKVIKEKVDKARKDLINDVKNNHNRNPFVVVEDFENVVNQSFKTIEEKLKEWDKSVSDFVNDDPINKKITELFKEKVGEDFTQEELENIYSEGEKRYIEKIPPGYKDNTKDKIAKGKRNVYGDLIIWKQIIERAKKEDKDVIFISDDEKEDWWYEWKGRKIYPNVELVREFRRETNHRVLLYNQRSFLEYANNNLMPKQLDNTIKEVAKDRKKQKEADRIASTQESIAEIWEQIKQQYMKSYMGEKIALASYTPGQLSVSHTPTNNRQVFISQKHSHNSSEDSHESHARLLYEESDTTNK